MRFLLAFKVLLFTALVPGTVILYFPYQLLSRSNASLHTGLILAVPAAACIVIGTAIYLRCAWDFAVEGLGTPAPIDPPKKLVVVGLYRWTRNPMYQGVVMLFLAEYLLFPDFGLLVYATSVALVFHLYVVLFEEPALVSRFGQSYKDYCLKVPRWGFAFRPFAANPA